MTCPAASGDTTALLARYRQAVADMLEADMEERLTASHLERIGCKNTPQAEGWAERLRMMKKFRILFGSIEPEHMRAIEEKLEAQYQHRDAQIRLQEKRERPLKKPMAEVLEEALSNFDENTRNLFGGMLPSIGRTVYAQIGALNTAKEFRQAVAQALTQWSQSASIEWSETMTKIVGEVVQEALEETFAAWLEEHP